MLGKKPQSQPQGEASGAPAPSTSQGGQGDAPVQQPKKQPQTEKGQGDGAKKQPQAEKRQAGPPRGPQGDAPEQSPSQEAAPGGGAWRREQRPPQQQQQQQQQQQHQPAPVAQPPGFPELQPQGPRGPPQQTWGKGRGRGRGAQHGQQRGPVQPQGQQRGPAPQHGQQAGPPFQGPRVTSPPRMPQPGPGFPAQPPGFTQQPVREITSALQQVKMAPPHKSSSPSSSTHQQQMRPTSGKMPSPPPTGSGDALQRRGAIKPGTRGRRIIVESNHVQLNLGSLKQAVHYDVAITPDTPKSLLREVMNLFGKEHYPRNHPAFDGRKNLYSPKPLPFGDAMTDKVQVEGENGRAKEFKVEIKLARYVDLSPLHDMLGSGSPLQDALMVLEIVLRNAPANTCISAGRSFFTPPQGQIIPLGEGMEMYYGFFQSAIRGWKPLLNIDVAHKAFPSKLNIIDLICEIGSDFRFTLTRDQIMREGVRDRTLQDVEKFLRTLKVIYEIPGQAGSRKVYRVNGFEAAPNRFKFSQDGKEMSVEQYFTQVKRVRLQYPSLPTLWVGARDRKPKIVLPLEFCTLAPAQVVNRKLTENQTSAMIKKAATDTGTRKNKIMTALNKANYNNSPCVREFGFSVGDKFETLDARVLEPPSLQYANNIVTPSKGVWRSDRSKFLNAAQINKWTIASVTRSQPRDIQKLATEILRNAAPAGMSINPTPVQPFTAIGGRQTVHDITAYFKTKKDFDLIFVVVPNSGPQYSYVKKAAEINVGCLTQCIKERTLMKLNPQTVVNILLKVNSKMNGVNHTFAKVSRPMVLSRPCMIMGADVTHPSPDARDIPSVAAVTASHDPNAFKYNICWRLQPPKVEIIEDLCAIVKEQLLYFYKMANCKPERIFFFRDGVSEGQFLQVQHSEINAIRKACKMLQQDGYEPKITFLVVQKRHHTRLFPTNPRDSEDRNNNVPAGTCVDTKIVNPTLQDFYLVSHASIQGVAKPTKYVTLWDENDMDNDTIEQLTYHLCHMFTRCNRSVSYPAPTYYAHLVAARAKVYIENDGMLDMEKLQEIQARNYTIMENIVKGKPMFFV